jgi:putative restriction endonuclease
MFWSDKMIDEFIHKFSHLRTDKNRKRWSALTMHQAPHKPFLLMSIMDLIEQGQITENFIEPSFELLELGLKPKKTYTIDKEFFEEFK